MSTEEHQLTTRLTEALYRTEAHKWAEQHARAIVKQVGDLGNLRTIVESAEAKATGGQPASESTGPSRPGNIAHITESSGEPDAPRGKARTVWDRPGEQPKLITETHRTLWDRFRTTKEN